MIDISITRPKLQLWNSLFFSGRFVSRSVRCLHLWKHSVYIYTHTVRSSFFFFPPGQEGEISKLEKRKQRDRIRLFFPPAE